MQTKHLARGVTFDATTGPPQFGQADTEWPCSMAAATIRSVEWRGSRTMTSAAMTDVDLGLSSGQPGSVELHDGTPSGDCAAFESDSLAWRGLAALLAGWQLLPMYCSCSQMHRDLCFSQMRPRLREKSGSVVVDLVKNKPCGTS